ncbi:peptidyl-prolyl cis-trans isomerase [Roseovarius aestuariivivens]|uniref:peptidyl-prolyl cis-trans isomerase n=1 Tax=Roseovarius aestuariivivens TaxID=1888910 RepID=UPI001080A173|nr:peptidyl-prolyl cis-trans isomerase [Roseovarius aestuariivivens]
MAAKSITKPLVWILMGLLILGLGGFGVTNLSGTQRAIGSVGEAEITVNDYFRGLQRELRAIEAGTEEPMSFARARQLGVTDQVLAQLVTQAALDHETMQLGLSVGDEALARQILELRQFTGPDGQFNREAYRFTLEQVGLNEAQFEEEIRDETARSFLQAAVLAGVQVPEVYTEVMTAYLGERRSVVSALLTRADLELGVPEPTDTDLEAYHAANAEAYTRPETKRITYAWLSPDMIIDTVEIDESALREAYAAREAEFNQPERRLVERLVFPDTGAAEAAAARLEAGEATFEDLVAERGLELGDVDMGVQAEADLGAAGAAVFAVQTGEIAGPVETGLGPALFRVNAVLDAQVTTFEEAEPILRDAMAADRARRVIEAQMESIDDLLAGGATLEDLAQETEMELGEIAWHAGMDAGIAAYEGFREAAQAVGADDYPEVETLDDGGLFALRLEEVVPPALRPLDEVRAAVEAAWTDAQVATLLRAQAEPLAARLEAGESFADVGLSVDLEQQVTRQGFVADAPDQFIDTVFGMEEGEVRVIEGPGRIFVLQLQSIAEPDPEDPDLAQSRDFLRDNAVNGLSQDLFNVLATDIRARAGIELDQAAINAVHANFQ